MYIMYDNTKTINKNINCKFSLDYLYNMQMILHSNDVYNKVKVKAPKVLFSKTILIFTKKDKSESTVIILIVCYNSYNSLF